MRPAHSPSRFAVADSPRSIDWCSLLVVMQGVFCLWIGLIDPTSPVTLLVGIAALAVFMEAGNGACYAIVPFVKPEINGLMGGSVGAAGNLVSRLFMLDRSHHK